MKRIALITLLVFMPLLAYAGEKFGMVFDVQGNVELKSDGKAIRLRKDRHILYPVKDGDRIEVIGNGKVVVVSVRGKQGYEIISNSSALIKDNKITAIKGTVNVKEGFHAPQQGASGPIGAVVLRGVIKEPCIRTVSPVNTAILELTPELRWSLNCKGLKKVSVRILAVREVIFNAETEENSIKVPEGILKYGETYRWLVDGGPAFGIIGGTFSIPEENEAKGIKDKIGHYRAEAQGLPERLSFVFYLMDNRLNEYANTEIDLLEKEFPENTYIKELKK